MQKNTFSRATLYLIAILQSFGPAFAENVPVDQLGTEWNFYGIGSRNIQSGMLYMEEAPESKGVMVVSPEPYSGDIVLRYEIMPMSAASVCVAMICASDLDNEGTLTIPDGYDGSMGLWIKEKDNYFFAFHNAAHNRPPFLKRFPANEKIGEYDHNVLHAGAFNTIEVRKEGATLSFSVNGKRLYQVKDSTPLDSGHIAFRIRGIPQQTASCLIRNIQIESAID